MGGLALKHLGVQRIDAAPYRALVRKVSEVFWILFRQELQVIPAYFDKPDFGDCDALVVSSQLPEDWRTQLSSHFNSPGMSKNGDVTSMAIENVQFDFISVPANRVSQAYTYFAYNDLGNLMGRVAHKMGFKYGHVGFQLVVRNDHHVLASLDPEAQLSDVFDFLGYDYSRWLIGFKKLSDVFEFAASSQYFSPEIYLLHNRNAVSRVRDAKRRTYTEFLKWCEDQSGRAAWPWAAPDDTAQKLKEKEFHKQRAFERWPQLRIQFDAVQAAEAERLVFTEKFNGDLINDWTKLEGQALGQYIAWIKKQPEWPAFPQQSPEWIAAFVRDGVSRWLSENWAMKTGVFVSPKSA